MRSPAGFAELDPAQCYNVEPKNETFKLRQLLAQAMNAVVELQLHVLRLERELESRQLIKLEGDDRQRMPQARRHTDRGVA